jgi:hypothetical protein
VAIGIGVLKIFNPPAIVKQCAVAVAERVKRVVRKCVFDVCGSLWWFTVVVHCGVSLWCLTVVSHCGVSLWCLTVVHCGVSLWFTVVHWCSLLTLLLSSRAPPGGFSLGPSFVDIGHNNGP